MDAVHGAGNGDCVPCLPCRGSAPFFPPLLRHVAQQRRPCRLSCGPPSGMSVFFRARGEVAFPFLPQQAMLLQCPGRRRDGRRLRPPAPRLGAFMPYFTNHFLRYFLFAPGGCAILPTGPGIAGGLFSGASHAVPFPHVHGSCVQPRS